jgi:putative flippase GtrA
LTLPLPMPDEAFKGDSAVPEAGNGGSLPPKNWRQGLRKVFWFGIAGSIGFLVDAGLLMLILHFTPIDPFGARAISIPAAMLATWFFNRTFTFGRSSKSVAVEGFRYGFIGVVSALINYGIYSSLLISIPILRPTFALVMASAAATAFSFFGYSRFVFRR